MKKLRGLSVLCEKNLRCQGYAPKKLQIHTKCYEDVTPTERIKDYRQRTADYRRMKNEK